MDAGSRKLQTILYILIRRAKLGHTLHSRDPDQAAQGLEIQAQYYSDCLCLDDKIYICLTQQGVKSAKAEIKHSRSSKLFNALQSEWNSSIIFYTVWSCVWNVTET